MDELVEFGVVSFELFELIDFSLELPYQHVLLLALALGCEVRLRGWLGVVEILAEHNGYNLL